MPLFSFYSELSRWPRSEPDYPGQLPLATIDAPDEDTALRLHYAQTAVAPVTPNPNSFGWLAPNGAFYPCKFTAQHSRRAYSLVAKLYPRWFEPYGAMDDVLLSFGWVKVESWGDIQFDQPPTEQQYAVLETLNVLRHYRNAVVEV